MNKQEYLTAIREKIKAMPAEDIERFTDYYSEMIDDRIEDGLSEDDAVADMVSPDDAVEQILSDMPLAKIVKEKIKPKHELKAWEVILIILGSPVWIPLLITAAVLLLTCGIVSVIPLFIAHCPYAAFLMLGAALIGTGIAILFIVSVKPVTVGIFKVCKASVNGIKRMFVKER